MSSINLSKGAKVDLTKTNPGVKAFQVGLGWNPNSAANAQPFDIDVSAFVLGENGKLISDKHFIFYNNLKSENGLIEHTGDNRTGEGEGDDESLIVDFSKATGDEKSIVFVTSIHDAAAKNQNFGQISGSFIRVLDKATGSEILKFDLNEDYSSETAMVFGKLYSRDGEWKFEAIGEGKKEGLQFYLDTYKTA
jgi:tellurium resistance protein TerD